MTGTATVWLINPKGRGDKGRTATMSNPKKKPRTDAQKAATAKMLAANKAKRKAATGHAAPKKAKRTYTKKAASSAKKVVYKKNPLPPRARKQVDHAKNILEDNLIPAAIGAGGALAFDIIWGKLPISPKLRAGNLKYPVKVLGALALGMAAEHLLPESQKHHAVTLARGGLTVILHDAAKDFMASTYPSLHLAAYEEETLAEIMQLNGYQDALDDAVGVRQIEALPEPELGDGEELGESLELQGLSAAFYNQPQYADAAY